MDDQQRAREQFEAWCNGRYNLATCQNQLDNDVYVDRWVQGAWVGFRAALRAAPEGFVMVRKEAIDWLNGETGEGFECPPDRYFRGEPPRYWWRSVFREKAGLIAARPQGVK